MTAEEIVAALAEALPHETWCNRSAPALDDDDTACAHNRLSTARQILPTVRRVAEQRAAEELLAAARDDGISTHKLTPVEVLTLRVVKLEALFARAAALTATPNHGRNATT